MTIALQAGLYILVPLLALWLESRFKFFEIFNPVVFCYVAGMIMANTPLAAVDISTAKSFTEASIPLAVPLILFGSDFKAWLQQSRATVLSFLCALVAVIIAATSAAFLMGPSTDEYWKISGMLVGTYSGGTPNLMSIGMALEANEETFALLNAADVVMGGIYLVVLITFFKPLLAKVLPAFEADEEVVAQPEETELNPLHMVLAFVLSAVIVAASAGVTWLAVGELAIAGVFLGLTTGGILASFNEHVRGLAGSYELGNYLILVFCVAMGARTDLAELLASGGAIMAYTAFVVCGSVIIHVALAALLRIDVDTLIITSTAAVYGPAFVPPIAEAIDNRQVVLSGLTAGLVGYAVANYLGILMATLLAP